MRRTLVATVSGISFVRFGVQCALTFSGVEYRGEREEGEARAVTTSTSDTEMPLIYTSLKPHLHT